MTMTNAEISKRIKDSDLSETKANIEKHDLLETIQWRIDSEHEHLVNVPEMISKMDGHDELKEKISNVYNNKKSKLHSVMLEWYEDEKNEFFISGHLASENKFVMKIKLRANNSGDYFKDIDGTATVTLKLHGNGDYTTDTFFAEEDLKLVEKQADIWLASYAKKNDKKVKPKN